MSLKYGMAICLSGGALIWFHAFFLWGKDDPLSHTKSREQSPFRLRVVSFLPGRQISQNRPRLAFHLLTTGPIRTTSKFAPLIVFNMPRSSLLQRESGAPLKNQPGPLSATNIPYFFSARRITWFAAE